MGIEAFVRMLQSRPGNVDIVYKAQTGAVASWMKVAALAEVREISLARCVIPKINVHLLAAMLNSHLVEHTHHAEAITKTHLEPDT